MIGFFFFRRGQPVEINLNQEPLSPWLIAKNAKPEARDFSKAANGTVIDTPTEFRIGVPILATTIAKAADGSEIGIYVSGWASVSEYEDSQHDIIDAAALYKAMETWPGNIREMHDPIAVGTAKGEGCIIEMREHPTTKTPALWIKALIVAPLTIAKVKAGVLRAFSIGGRCRKSVIEEIEYDDGLPEPVSAEAA